MNVREPARAELHEVSALLASIWRPTDPMPYEMLCVVRHLGGYVAAAYEGAVPVGAAVAFPTAGGGLHSHITGAVMPGVGFALKQHQRRWAIEHGIPAITWTFDPLVRRNAYFNLAKLAARADAYAEDFYGDMPDELNAGDPSDRLMITWPLADPAVARAADGHPRTPPPADAALLDGDLVTGEVTGERLSIATPSDIAALRATDPERARAWRTAQRAALTGALAGGYRIVGFARSGEYVLEPAMG